MSSNNGNIQLSFSAMQAAEDALRGNLNAMKARLSQLEAELQPLVGSWSGTAKDAYLIQKKQWETAAEALGTMLNAIINGLNQTNTDFTDAQSRITNQFH